MKPFFTQALSYLVLSFFFLAPQPANSQANTSFDVEVSADNTQVIKILPLPGSRLGVLTWDNTVTNVYLWIYNSSGVRTANIDITAQINWTHTTHGAVNINAITTGNGNIFIAYLATSNSTGIQTYNARYVLINDAGMAQASGQLNTTDAAGNYLTQVQLDNLSDGKVVAAWRRYANDNVLFRLFNADGSPFASDVAFAGPGTVNSAVTNSQYIKLAGGKNGNFMAAIYHYDGGIRGFAFTNNGINAISGGATSFTIDPNTINNYALSGIIALANGNFAAGWWLSGTNYVQVMAPDGNIIVNKQSITPTFVSGMFPIHSAGSEGFIITESIRQNPADATNLNYTMWFHRYNQTGVLQSSTAAPEGAMLQPNYQFVNGGTAGYAYLYSYYKSVMIMPFPMNMAFVTGDMDTKGVLNGFLMYALPVSLVSYEVNLLTNRKAQLTWSTGTETNSSHFEIQRSTDGRTFTGIGQVTAKGNSNHITSYSFTDEEPITQTTYYRLRQFDLDGKWKDMGIKAVRYNSNSTQASVYPNPVNGSSITVLAGNEPLPATYRLTDLQGRTIRLGVLRQVKEDLDVQRLTPGIYLLHIGTKQVIKIKK